MKNENANYFSEIFFPSVFKHIDESEMILSFLGRSGFFLDVGANDPFVESQTYELEKQGWQGICVEPQPKFAEKLKAERKALVVECACGTADTVGNKIKLFALDSNAALHPDRVLFRNYDQIRDVVEVELNTVDNILRDSKVKKLDFVSIDVEGYEMEVLLGFSLKKWAPRLIFIEDHLYNHSIYKYIQSQGYKLVRRTELNMWYVPNSEMFLVSPYGRWQLFRKLYLSHPFRLFRKFVKSKSFLIGAR